MSFVWFVTSRRVRETGFFFFQAEDGIRDLVRSRGLGDVYKRQTLAIGGGLGDIGRPEIHVLYGVFALIFLPFVYVLSLIHI